MRPRALFIIACLALLGAAFALPAPSVGASGPPSTKITFGPSGWTNLTNPVWAYESDDPEARFECRMDRWPFAPCNFFEYQAPEGAPGPITKLADGPHTFEVRAVNLAGEVDPTPARVRIIVDTDSPFAAILSGPNGPTRIRRPRFTFRLEGQDSFHCVLRGRSIRIPHCTGRRSFRPPRPLPPGKYVFRLIVANRAGSENFDEREFEVLRRTARR